MISRITLSDFRNHEDALILPAHDFIVLSGENGAGKTNILEAISLLAPGRGMRGAALPTMARQDGRGGFGIAAQVGGVMLGTGVQADAPERRQVRINGVSSSAPTLAEHLSIVWLTPAMDRLFMDGAGGRRRFLDRLTLALSPSHAVHASRYEAAMRSRNKLLAQGRNADPQWMSALEAQMQEHGSALSHARAQLVLHLNAVLADVPDAPFARPGIAITGAIGEEHAGLADYLREGRGRDAAAGRTLIGPHRADISVTHKAKDQAAALCSTGEQKALLLSILLAHAQLIADKRGAPPVLLLDEIAAHIDPVRRLALFERLRGTGSQVWMTGTEAGLFDEIGPASLLRVENGQVLQISL